MIKSFLNIDVDDTPFFYNNGEIISRKKFVKDVTKLQQKLNSKFKTDSYVYIQESKPYNFYTLLFALWISNTKVVFPTKINLDDNIIPKYCKYTISMNDELEIIKNENFNINLKIGDTILFSSGSTGIPKGIIHKKENFFINALDVVNLLKLNYNNSVSITYLNPYLVSALSHFLVHWYTKSMLIFDKFENISNISEYKDLSANINIVGSPIHIINSLQYIKKSNIKPYYFFSSGDMISDTIIEDILDTFDNTIFFKVYGLAEVAGRLFINKIDNKNKINFIGKHIESVNVKYIENEVIIKSKILYLAYIKENKIIKSENNFYTGDLVIIENDRVILSGRKNDEIKVGGNKVSLKYLENIILTVLKRHKINLAIVLSKKHQILGNTILLVLDKKLEKKIILKDLRTKLKVYQIPHEYFYINSKDIPFTQSMKIDRKKILEMIILNDIKIERIL